MLAMIVKSFLAIPKSGQLENLAQYMSSFSNCEVVPPTNSKELLVLIIESSDQTAEDSLIFQLKNNPALEHLVLVSAFTEPTIKAER
jgi:nitrate reductase NapAB chaperone NapD